MGPGRPPARVTSVSTAEARGSGNPAPVASVAKGSEGPAGSSVWPRSCDTGEERTVASLSPESSNAPQAVQRPEAAPARPHLVQIMSFEAVS